MAGDVVTAGTAGHDVTQDLPAADDRVTPPAAMSGRAASDDTEQSDLELPETELSDTEPSDTEPSDTELSGNGSSGTGQQGAERARGQHARPGKGSPGGKKSGNRVAVSRAARRAAQPAETLPAGPAAPDGTPASRRPPSGGGWPGWARPAAASVNPVLEPLIKTVRTTHPKADIRLVERAYETAARMHAGQSRNSGDPYITHPLAVATILAELGIRSRHDLRRAAARHGRGHRLHAGPAAPGLRRGHRRPGRRRDQAGQGQVRRRGPGRDRAQDGRRDVARHPGTGDQARRPAAQHAHAALHPAGEAGAEVPRGAGDLRSAGAPARA